MLPFDYMMDLGIGFECQPIESKPWAEKIEYNDVSYTLNNREEIKEIIEILNKDNIKIKKYLEATIEMVWREYRKLLMVLTQELASKEELDVLHSLNGDGIELDRISLCKRIIKKNGTKNAELLKKAWKLCNFKKDILVRALQITYDRHYVLNIQNHNTTVKIKRKKLHYNHALFLLFGLEFKQLYDSDINMFFYNKTESNVVFKEIPKSLEPDIDIIQTKQGREYWDRFYKMDIIDVKDFLDWAVEKKFLKVVKNPSRLIRKGVAKDLFKKLKEGNYIPKESVFDNQWEWKKTDKSLAHLASLLSIKKIISSAKIYQKLAAYIPKAENPNLKNALRRMTKTPNKDKEDLEEIVNSLPKK